MKFLRNIIMSTFSTIGIGRSAGERNRDRLDRENAAALDASVARAKREASDALKKAFGAGSEAATRNQNATLRMQQSLQARQRRVRGGGFGDEGTGGAPIPISNVTRTLG